MEGGSARSGGIVKKKSSSGCLIIKKKDERMGIGGGGGGVGVGSSRASQKVKKRPRLVQSDSESSDEELLEPIGRRGGEKFHNGSVKSGGESRELGRNGKIESERKRSRLDLFDFDEYDEFDEEMKWNVARTGGSSREFVSGSSSRSMMVEKRKHLNIESSSNLSGSRAKGDECGVKKRYDLDEDEAHMPISLLRLKYQQSSQEPIRLQGKNGVLKVMVNKKKKVDLSHKDSDLESRKGSRSEDVVKKDLLGRASLHSDSKRPEKRPLSVKTEQTELKSQKPFLAKCIKSVDRETDETDTSLKLAPPSSQPASSKMRAVKEESRSAAAEDVTPAKSKEGKLKQRGSMEKQQLQPASSKARVIKEESRSVAAEDVTPAKSKGGNLKRGGSTEKQQLREKIRGMLIEAGWTIDYRPRRNRDYLDAVYINPSGTAYWSIIKAYDALQKQSGEDSCKSKIDGGSSSFAPLSDELINKLTRQTRKKIEKELKKKRKDDAKNRVYKKSAMQESAEDTDGDQHEERLSSYVKKKGKLLKCKSHATDQESDGDTSGNSSKGGRSKQDMSGKSFTGAASSAVQGRKSRIIGRCTLLVRRSDKEQDSEDDGYVPYTGKRTLLAWMIDSGTVKLSQKVQYMNRRRTRVKLEGWITRDGVHCGCCSKILPVSKFELHAGSTLRQPFQNIILESGVSLLECLVDAWNRQEESERQDFHTVNVDGDDPDDDTCGICGDGGDLICCDGCPSTFHQSCLGIQMLPPGDWHCPNCTCKFCGTANTTAEEGQAAADMLLYCSLCEKKYHKSCSLDINALPASSNNPSVSFCGQKCQELYDHLQKILGVKHEIEAGFSWSLIQRTELDSDRSHHSFSQRVECNSKLAVALAVMDECFLPIVDRKSGINIIHNVLYNCGSNFSRLNFRGFYTAILERGDEIISAASIRIHGTQLAEMPYIGTRNIYRRQGMCRRLLSAIETVLSTLKVEKLIIPAISEHMHTWTVVFGFNPLEESEKLEMKSINMLVFPGTDMLQKRLLNRETLEGGKNAGDSKHNVPQLPALVEKADQESLTKCDGNLRDEACIEKVDDVDAIDSDSPATAVDLSGSAMVREESTHCGSHIQISSQEDKSVKSNMEKKLAEPTTKSIPSSPSGASIGNTDLGDAALGPSSEVDAQSSEPIHQKICTENDQTTCSIFGFDSSDEASARNTKAEKQNVVVSDTTSIDANGKSLSADTTDSCFLEPAAQSEVEEIDKTKVSVCVSATCASAKPAINFFSDTTSGPDPQNGLHVAALKQTSDVKHLGDLNISVEEGNLDASPIGDNHGAEVSSSKPAIDSSGETSLKQTFDVKRLGNSNFSVEEGNLDASQMCDGVDVNNGTEVSSSTPAIDSSVEASLKQTSDVEWFGGSNVSVEGGNLDASPIGGVNNGAEVSSSRPAIDSSVEISLNAALVNNTDCQLDLSPGSQACGSSLNSSDASAEAKASFNEKIVHSEPSQAESHEVTVVSSCSATVYSSAYVSSAQRAAEETGHAAEETAVGSQAESQEVTVLGSCSGTIHSSDDVSAQHAREEKIQTEV
ncbi:PREDICTED: uncharacterized protein LOC109209538 isoform X2 [Nicotiana attenuata]|uniref:uncharacterized protein LOC109209538 isoform X2 n=1 Tax=Nicotiana attenuata TaxID=49451 RepID=UPI0009055F9A|nr:PREDICTED: uncharacterized protein LOC109209538 isoform X2 [Nicotiana attenuata]